MLSSNIKAKFFKPTTPVKFIFIPDLDKSEIFQGLTTYKEYLDKEMISHIYFSNTIPGFPFTADRVGAAFRDLKKYPTLYNSEYVRSLIYNHPPHEMIIAEAIIHFFTQMGKRYLDQEFYNFVQNHPQDAAHTAINLEKTIKAEFIPEKMKLFIRKNLEFCSDIFGSLFALHQAGILDKLYKNIEQIIFHQKEKIPFIYATMAILMKRQIFDEQTISVLFSNHTHAETLLDLVQKADRACARYRNDIKKPMRWRQVDFTQLVENMKDILIKNPKATHLDVQFFPSGTEKKKEEGKDEKKPLPKNNQTKVEIQLQQLKH